MKLEILAAAPEVLPPAGTIFEPVYLGVVGGPGSDDQGLSFANAYTGTWTSNATGYYEVICIGGGQGATGGNNNPTDAAGPGGDSGAGALNVQYLTSGTSYSYTIGGAGRGEARIGQDPPQRGSSTSFGSLSAAGGGEYDSYPQDYLKVRWSEGGPASVNSGSYDGSTNGGGGTEAANSGTKNFTGRVFSQLDATISHGAGGTSYGGSWGGSGGGGGFSTSTSFNGSALSGDNRVGTPSPQGGQGYGAGGGGGAGNHGNARSITRGGRGARGYVRLKFLGSTPNTSVYTTATPTISNVWVANVELAKADQKAGAAEGGTNDVWHAIIFNPFSANTQQARAITTLSNGSNSSANAVNLSDTKTGAIWITLDKIPCGNFTLRVTTVDGDVGRYHIGASNFVGNGRFISQILRTSTAGGNPGPYPGVKDNTLPGGYKHYFITSGTTTGENNRIQDIRIV